MPTLGSIFNSGKSALFANQKALSVTSQNLANVNTVGYSRQEVILEPTNPLNERPGQIGTGVQVSEVRRISNKFVESQVTVGRSNLGRLEAEGITLGRVETAFSDSEGTGLNKSLTELFGAVNDLTNQPQGRAERVMVLERAKILAQKFSVTNTQLKDVRSSMNEEVSSIIQDINLIATQVADLNNQIARSELIGQQPNDLLDQRGRLINELAEKMDVNVFKDKAGQLNILVAGGRPLVEGERAASLQGLPNADNSGFQKVMFDPGTGSTFDITPFVSNGRMKALLEQRDTVLPGLIDQLDRLAAGVVNEVNQQHKLGFGLDGSTGLDLFSPISPTAIGATNNAGSATISATVSDPTALTFQPYELKSSGGLYTLKNLTTGVSVSGAGPSLTLEGMTVTQTGGAPVEGDIFRVSAHQGLAGNIAVAITDPNKLAASSSLATTPGDNANALAIARIQDKSLSGLGGVTVQGFYTGFTGEVGSRSQSAQRRLDAEEIVQRQLVNLREEASGVSIDEEMTNLIKYQRAFEASARIITTTDQLFETILAMKR